MIDAVGLALLRLSKSRVKLRVWESRRPSPESMFQRRCTRTSRAVFSPRDLKPHA